MSYKKYLLALLLFSSHLCIHPHMCDNAYFYQWKATYIDKMSLEEKQILANLIHLLHANSIIESKIHQFSTPITRLTQAIKNSVDNHYEKAHEDIIMLKTLLDRLDIVIGTRIIYNKMLNTAIAHYNKNTTPLIEACLNELQLYAQQKLQDWANTTNYETSTHLKSCSETIDTTIKNFQAMSELYKQMSENYLPIKINSADEKNRSLIMLSLLLENNPQLLHSGENIINSANTLFDHASGIIPIGEEIYKQFYMVMYHSVMSSSSDEHYKSTLFGMHDLLPQEYKKALPDPNHVFEHILHSTKLYTHVEFLQP